MEAFFGTLAGSIIDIWRLNDMAHSYFSTTKITNSISVLPLLNFYELVPSTKYFCSIFHKLL
jgi:hypothetical protein